MTPQNRRKLIEARYPTWEVMTISERLDRAVELWADQPLIITDARTWSYGEVQAWSRQIASGLIAHGLKAGDHVALDMANYPEFTAVKFAIARAGAVCIPVNFMLRGQELAYVLDQSDAVMLITMEEFRGHDYLADLEQIRPNLPKMRHIFTLAGIDDLIASATPQSDSELSAREAAADGNALSDILYTSGTTGRSKGVMLKHDMVLRAAFSSVIAAAFEDHRRMLFAMPMYHVFGYSECLLAVLYVGGAIVPRLVFDAEEMLEAAERHQATEIVAVPMMTTKLIEVARTRGFDSTHLKVMFNSGGVNPPGIWEAIREVLGPQEMRMGYGMTETSASATSNVIEDDDSKLNTTHGRFKPPNIAGDPEIGGRVAVYKTIDPETLVDLPPDQEGELVVRGPIVTPGYYKKPEETEASFTADGWLRTGDVGRVSSDGYVTLTGRIKETYRCNGEMVMPREIEMLFDDHPQIEQALVVGVPDARAGETGCLCIVPRGTDHPEGETLLAECAAKLARFKVPRHVLYFEASDIPLTVTGRPQKSKLAKIALERIQGET